MATLTSDEIADFRADIGDTNSAFTDAEIQRLYVRSGESYEGAILLGIDQLLSNAVKLADYTSGESSEKQSQIFANLNKMRDIWQARYNKTKNPQQVQMSGMKAYKRLKVDPYA